MHAGYRTSLLSYDVNPLNLSGKGANIVPSVHYVSDGHMDSTPPDSLFSMDQDGVFSFRQRCKVSALVLSVEFSSVYLDRGSLA